MLRFGIALWALVAGLLLVAGFFALAVRRRKAAGWVLVCVAVVAVMLFAAQRSGNSHRFVEQQPARVDVSRPRMPGGQDRSDRTRPDRAAPVYPADRAPFLADVYPSPELAAEAMATDLARRLEVIPAGHAVAVPRVGVTGTASKELQDRIESLVRRNARVLVNVKGEGPPPATQPEEPTILCEVNCESGDKGTIEIIVDDADGRTSRSARFVQKPWAADFSGFVGGSPAGRHWILAQSDMSLISPQEAERAALRDAAERLLDPVYQSVRRQMASGRLPRHAMPRSDVWLPTIEAELQNEGLISDRFVQRFSRPYANLWRESLLIDASPPAVERLAHQVAVQAAAWRMMRVEHGVTIALSMAGVVLLVILGYLLSNSATKGYYAWPLRLSAGGLMAAGTVLVLLVA